MIQVIEDFKAIMADKRERRDFIAGFACVVVAVAVLYMMASIFQ